MSHEHPTHFANGHTSGRMQSGRTVDWAGYPALFERVAPKVEPAASRRREVEVFAAPTAAVGRSGGVREAFLGFCQAALFPSGLSHAWQGESAAAERVLVAAEAFGFTRDEVRRLGCGLYAGPAAIREDLREVGFGDAEIDAARMTCDETGRPRAELAGCLVVPLTDETGRLCDFLFVSVSETGRGFGGYRYLDGPARSNVVAYGLQVALSRPAGRRSLVLVDDVLDALLLQCRGVQQVAAVGGTGQELTPRRWEELARLGVTSVTLAFRRDDRHAASVRDALVGALRARTAPEIFAANPYPAGERAAADVLRRFGKHACEAALDARSLAFHDKDFGAEARVRAVAEPTPVIPFRAPEPQYRAPEPRVRTPEPQPAPLPAEPYHRAAFRKHLAELAAGLPTEERAIAEELIDAVGQAISLGDFARAAWRIDAASTRFEAVAPVAPAAGWFWSTWPGGYAAPRQAPWMAAPPAPMAGYVWPVPVAFQAWPAAGPAPTCHPLTLTECGRAVLDGLRAWVRREREVAAA